LAVQPLGLVKGAEPMEAGCEGRNVGRRNHEGRQARTSVAKPKATATRCGSRRLARPSPYDLRMVNKLSSPRQGEAPSEGSVLLRSPRRKSPEGLAFSMTSPAAATHGFAY
jgi:hypothetical protein